MGPLRLFLLVSLFCVAFSHEAYNPHLPRALIIEYPENSETDSDEVQIQCTSWRIAGEANNLSPWMTVPEECEYYVRGYMIGRGYAVDLERASDEARAYARSVALGSDGKDVWVFDVDETLLSNLPYYAEHRYGSEAFNHLEFDEWVVKAAAPAIDSSLRLYEEIMDLGFKVFLLTGRSEQHRSITVENLVKAGFKKWDKLILRGTEDHGKLATVYKSDKRNEMVEEGFRIHGNSGDQWSDLLGSSMAVRSFKLPNPMYFIP